MILNIEEAEEILMLLKLVRLRVNGNGYEEAIKITDRLINVLTKGVENDRIKEHEFATNFHTRQNGSSTLETSN